MFLFLLAPILRLLSLINFIIIADLSLCSQDMKLAEMFNASVDTYSSMRAFV